MTKLVRLKPHNPKKGCVLSRYNYASQVYTAGNWYEVPDDLAYALAEQLQDESAAVPVLAFDLVDDIEAAEEFEENERLAAQRMAQPERVVRVVGKAPAGTLTTKDLPENQDEDEDDYVPPPPVKVGRGRPKKTA